MRPPCCTQPNAILRLTRMTRPTPPSFFVPTVDKRLSEPPLPLEVLFDELKKWISIHTISFIYGAWSEPIFDFCLESLSFYCPEDLPTLHPA